MSAVPGVFMRGGTSKRLFLHEADLPPAGCERDELLRRMGSPDPYSRQLDGLGGGLYFLSKVMLLRRAAAGDTDAAVKIIHGQVAVDRALVDGAPPAATYPWPSARLQSTRAW